MGDFFKRWFFRKRKGEKGRYDENEDSGDQGRYSPDKTKRLQEEAIARSLEEDNKRFHEEIQKKKGKRRSGLEPYK